MNRSRIGIAFSSGVLAIVFVGCGGRMPSDLGVRDARLMGCPPSPNCVSSFATDEGHAIDAFGTRGDPNLAWQALRAEVARAARVEIVSESDDYLHAVYTSRLMRYRDDVEFLLNRRTGRIEVRSASRVGYGDMNVNRDRVERLRRALAADGFVVESSTSN